MLSRTYTARPAGSLLEAVMHSGGFMAAVKAAMAAPPIAPTTETDLEAEREREQRERDERQRQRWREQRESVFRKLCPPLYLYSDPARLPADKLAEVLAWQPNPDGHGMFLVGPARTGKTRCVWLLLRRLVVKRGLAVKAFDGVGWQIAVARAFGDPGTTEAWFDSLVEPAVLFIDDLFKGRITEAIETAVHGILERRAAHLKPVFITSNTDGKTLVARMTESGRADRAEAILGRIKEFCDVIRF